MTATLGKRDLEAGAAGVGFGDAAVFGCNGRKNFGG